ncbi:MAG: penicillin-binding protein 2 [Saprospiraceae bacterium]|nr:penicillin-binding protein 2 [Saprospiraceae bacterium]MBK7787404.1 penicillin-binding protein 2 [Saprospiraceae bacterium]MBK8109784.1 penicillin-binding protein 2 [Saprospiraceae bacterium]
MINLANRRNNIIIFVALCGSMLLFKAAHLQLLDVKYKEKAKKAALYKNVLYPSRGMVMDRNEKLLVTNAPLYDLNVIYRNIDPKMDTAEFCTLLGIDKTTFIKNLEKDWKNPLYHKSVPFPFLTKIRPEQFARFFEHLHKFPGFYPVLKSIRSYPHHNAAHVLGYLGEVNWNVINKSAGEYSLGDYIGISGLEKGMEKKLKGKKGISYVLKDNLGRQVGLFDNGRLDSMALSGFDMMSGLDLELQEYGEALMKGRRGAIVAIEPSTGEILAMVSAPSYDPNSIALDKNRSIAFDSLLSDTINRPFLDRSLIANYPPGSIFKPVFSLIALQKGIVQPNTSFYCDGAYEISSSKAQKCHSHPPISNIGSAIQYSCNSYYYHLMRQFVNQYGFKRPGLGLDTLVSYLKEFGLGQKLGVENPAEIAGFVPDSKYYDRLYRREVNGWKATYMLSIGIGQGELQVSTLQMANLATVIANRGYYYPPHLIKKYLNTSEPIDIKFRTKRKVRIDYKYFDPVIDGMQLAVEAGTARAAILPGITVCGKTGTSQNRGKDHSVFFGFAPRENPKIAIAVYVEHGGWGGETATPIAGLMIEKFIKREISPEKKQWEERMMDKTAIKVLADNSYQD